MSLIPKSSSSSSSLSPVTAETLIDRLRYWADAQRYPPRFPHGLFNEAADALAALQHQQQEAETTLKAACDRTWEQETLPQIAAIASNAIYWRGQEIEKLRQKLTEAETTIATLTQELDAAQHKRVTKRERREWEDIEGDARTLRGYIHEVGETPAMTASNREHWKRRAEQAEEAHTALLDQVLTIVDAAMTHVAWRDHEPQITIHRQRLRDEIAALRVQPTEDGVTLKGHHG